MSYFGGVIFNNSGCSGSGCSYPLVNASRWASSAMYTTPTAGDHKHTMNLTNTGNNEQHNNMQPYIAVNMWKRIE